MPQTSSPRGSPLSTLLVLVLLTQVHHWLCQSGLLLVEGTNPFKSWYWAQVKLDEFKMDDRQYEQCDASRFDRRLFGLPQLTTEALLEGEQQAQRQEQQGQPKQRAPAPVASDTGKGATSSKSEGANQKESGFPYQFVTLQQLGEGRKSQLLQQRLDIRADRYKNVYFGILEIITTRPRVKPIEHECAPHLITQMGDRYLNYMRANLVREIAQQVERHWPRSLRKMTPDDRKKMMAGIVEEAFEKCEDAFFKSLQKFCPHACQTCTMLQMNSYYGSQLTSENMFNTTGSGTSPGENDLFVFTGTLVIMHSQQRHMMVVKFGQAPLTKGHAKAMLLLKEAEPESGTDAQSGNGRPKQTVIDLAETEPYEHISDNRVGQRPTLIRIVNYRMNQRGRMRPVMMLMVSSALWTKQIHQAKLANKDLYKEVVVPQAADYHWWRELTWKPREPEDPSKWSPSDWAGPRKSKRREKERAPRPAKVQAPAVEPIVSPQISTEETVHRLSEAICGYYGEAAVQLLLSMFNKQFQQKRMRESGLVSLNRFIRQQWRVTEDTSLVMVYMNREHDWQANTQMLCQDSSNSTATTNNNNNNKLDGPAHNRH